MKDSFVEHSNLGYFLELGIYHPMHSLILEFLLRNMLLFLHKGLPSYVTFHLFLTDFNILSLYI
jgi:hypothetical protein